MPILVDTGAAELLRRRERRAETLVLRHYPPATDRDFQHIPDLVVHYLSAR